MGARPGLELFQVEVGEVWLDQPDAVVLEPAVPVRLDQRGLVLSAGAEQYRLDFPAPVDCPRCVAHALQLSHAGHC